MQYARADGEVSMDSIAYEEVVKMLHGAAAEVRANHQTLSKLDSVGGDGDHGTTMLRCMDAVEGAIAQSVAPAGLSALLDKAGWAVMGIDGGATGPLFGSFFLGMAEAAAGRDTLDAAGLAALFEEGLIAVRRRTKAQPGDKTMLDALVPAVAAVKERSLEGAGPVKALTAGAAAAVDGANATRAMAARFGRAKNIGEKSIGTEDPGAASVACIFKGFLEGVKNDA